MKLKQLFCKHNYKVLRWHYTHGINGDEPHIIEAELECVKCGKISYCDISRDKMAKFEKIFKDKKVL